jgi:hypothetical protein
MPSSSRAYPTPFEDKAAVCSRMFEDFMMMWISRFRLDPGVTIIRSEVPVQQFKHSFGIIVQVFT